MNYFDDKSLLRDEEARNRLSGNYCQFIDRARTVAQSAEIDVPGRLNRGNKYLNLDQDIRASVKYSGSEFRDATIRNNVMIFSALMTANRPRGSFMPVEPYDVPYTNVYRKLDDFYSNQMQFDLKYSIAVQDMFKYGTGFMMHFINETTGDLDLMVPTLAEILFDDWTKYDLAKHRRIYRLLVQPAQDVMDKYPHLMGKIDPSDPNNYTQFLQQMTPNWTQLSGTDNPLFRSFGKYDMQKEWQSGNVIGWEVWEKDAKSKVTRSCLYNGLIAEKRLTDHPDIPIVALRNNMQNGQVLGKSEADVCRWISDAITESIHSLLYHKALFSKGFITYSNRLGMSAPQVRREVDTFGAFGMDDNIFERGGVKLNQPQPLNQADTQLVPMFRDLANQTSGNSQWLQGTVAPGEDPASKVAYLQQAGLSRIKALAKMVDRDAIYRMWKLRGWYYSTIKAHKIIRIVGEKKPDGTPRFMDMNMELKRETMLALMDVANRADRKAREQARATGKPYVPPTEKVTGFQTAMTAEELRSQMQSIEARAAANGVVMTYKLNDLSSFRYDISVEDSDALPFNDAQRLRTIGMLAEMKKISTEEVRGTYGWPTDPESMSKVAADVPMIPAEQIAQKLEQAAQDPEMFQQAVMEVAQYIQQMQKVIQS
ncbi:MAG: hypothetical protein WC551_10650 [Patescibacteria group bacterium]